MVERATWIGQVVSIQIARKATDTMFVVAEVRAEAGRGLEGDRYFERIGTYSNEPGTGREVTLIEAEALEALKRDLSIEIDAKESRRNIVTRGVPLNHLVGREFMVGSVRLRGARLCEPCEHLEALTRKGVRNGLLHRGGLRAEILSDGIMKQGDPISEI